MVKALRLKRILAITAAVFAIIVAALIYLTYPRSGAGTWEDAQRMRMTALAPYFVRPASFPAGTMSEITEEMLPGEPPEMLYDSLRRRYRVRRDGDSYSLISVGRDGEPGTADDLVVAIPP